MARDSMPRSQPEGWKERRSGWTWGILAITLVAAPLAQYLAQILAGAIAGAIFGSEGLAKITASDVASLNQQAWWTTIILTVIITLYVVTQVRADLTWEELHSIGTLWGIEWWPHFWRPLLIGALLHGAAFGFAMVMWAAV